MKTWRIVVVILAGLGRGGAGTRTGVQNDAGGI